MGESEKIENIGKIEIIDTENPKIVIIGAGIAGLSCAETVRKESDNAEITMISNESTLPYYRLNLIKYLTKEIDKNGLTIHPENWYEEKRIMMITGKEVVEIKKDIKQLNFEDGTNLAYDKLIIASGAHSFLPPIKGNGLKNVFTLRTMEDADLISKELQKAQSCMCIGGGIQGLEVAGAIAKTGIKVTLLVSSEWLMPRQLNKKAGDKLKGHLQRIGIEVIESAKAQEIVGDIECEGVMLSTEKILPAKLVIISAGVIPNIQLAMSAGLEINKGLVVNDNMRTSDINIYAAGDVMEHSGVLYGLWNVAFLQGKTAAQCSLGMDANFSGIHRTNILKVLDIDMISIGELNLLDESYYQYEKETPETYITFILKDGKIVGSIVMGNKSLSGKVKMAIDKGLNFPRESYKDIESIIGKLS